MNSPFAILKQMPALLIRKWIDGRMRAFGLAYADDLRRSEAARKDLQAQVDTFYLYVKRITQEADYAADTSRLATWKDAHGWRLSMAVGVKEGEDGRPIVCVHHNTDWITAAKVLQRALTTTHQHILGCADQEIVGRA